MMIHGNSILSLNSRRIMCAVMSRREAAFPSAGAAGPMDTQPVATTASPTMENLQCATLSRT